MKKVLLFPLLNSMPSGHHQVADALCETIDHLANDIECKKVDLLSEWNSKVESAAVKAYLKWISKAPASYAWIYRKLAYKTKEERSYKYYELLFIHKIEQILEIEKPDLIICTHGFPSLFINKLKKSGKCSVPCLNVYTDFFMNDVWGKSHIDYHFVPNLTIKEQLQIDHDIPASHIFVTGIPVSMKFSGEPRSSSADGKFTVLISGGSTGLGNIFHMLENGMENTGCNFKILCGTNKSLYEKVKELGRDAAEPLPYISSKEEMNRLYGISDAIITKPGGVTVSEALKVGLPIFVQSALPGQEEINMNFLCENGLVFKVPEDAELIEFVCATLSNGEKMKEYHKTVKNYKASFDLANPKEVLERIENILTSG